VQIVILPVKIGQNAPFALEKAAFSLYNIQKERNLHNILWAPSLHEFRQNDCIIGAFIFIKHTIAEQAAIRRLALRLRTFCLRRHSMEYQVYCNVCV
jgi:hypothetical protein